MASTATCQQTFSIAPVSGNLQIDLSGVNSGSYSVILIIDSVAEDAKSLIIK
jgi:hypothetical protein